MGAMCRACVGVEGAKGRRAIMDGGSARDAVWTRESAPSAMWRRANRRDGDDKIARSASPTAS